jgi:ribonuclease J
MINIVSAAVELGYMKVPEGVLVDINDIKRYKPEELTLITTGSQGEPMSALYRMAFGEHSQVSLGYGDLVVLSASAIPGNEKLVGRIINELSKMGVTVLNDASMEVHVSGHACQEELKIMHRLVRPKYFIPIHGEYRMLWQHAELAESMGMPSQNIVLPEMGQVIEMNQDGLYLAEQVPTGGILVDGLGVGDVGNVVLRDRKHLSQDGLIIVVMAINRDECKLVSGPDLISRGFIYVRENEDIIENTRDVVRQILATNSLAGENWPQLKNRIKDELHRYILEKIKRNPMILPIILDV